MNYLALLGGDESRTPAPGSPEWDAVLAGHERFGEIARESILGGAALQPAATSTTVRHGDGEPLVTAGTAAAGAQTSSSCASTSSVVNEPGGLPSAASRRASRCISSLAGVGTPCRRPSRTISPFR